MRDPLAPVIEGFDCSGLVDPYSFQCEPFYVEGGNGGTLLDGTTIHDILAAKVRLSWTLNALSSEQYAALTAALHSGESPDTVSAYVFDPTCDAVRLAKFHVTRPAFQFVLSVDNQPLTLPGSELVLEEACPVARFAVTLPTKTRFWIGGALDLTGLTVTRYDNDGNAADITEECTVVPPDGTEFSTAGVFPVTVSLPEGMDVYTFTVTVQEPDAIVSGDWWTLYADGTLDIYCDGDMPSSEWDSYSDQILSVAIGDSVTSISDDAFEDCTALTSVTIPDSVTSIGGHAFQNCTALTSVTIPDSVTSIGGHAFQNCTALTSVTIPDSVTSIGYGTFYECTALTSVTIPKSVTSIGESAFSFCDALESIDVESGNNYYASENGVLFNKDKSLLVQHPAGKSNTMYIIPNSVTSIGNDAFYECTALTSVTIPKSVTSIGGHAFMYCRSLTSVTIPDSVTSIGYDTFMGCTSLTSVTIPDSVTSIGSYAFYECTALTSVTIPKSVTSIGGHAFMYCRSLTSVTIPDSVTSIGERAFFACGTLTSVTIGNSVTSIGDDAFYLCDALTSVTIGNSVTAIGKYAFMYCRSLTSVTIPDSVTSIGEGAFYACGTLTSVTIPDSVTAIGKYAFSYCNSLADVYYAGTESQWNAISIGSYNDPLTKATIHYNSTGPS